MTPATFRLLDGIADSFNPLLAIIGLAAPLLRKPRTLRSASAYYVSGGAAIGIVYLIRAVDSRQQLWASVGLDFSTHSAFAASVATSLAAFHRRWVGLLLVLLALYFCLQLVLRYHGVLDILSSGSLAAAVALLLHLVAERATRLRCLRHLRRT